MELKTGTRVSVCLLHYSLFLLALFQVFQPKDSFFFFESQEVIIGPENRTATANDNFLKVNLIGDFGGYTSIPSFEDFYLAIPREVKKCMLIHF